MIKLNKKGFTLVELLAVIVILALLMVVATRTIGGSLSKSKEAAIETEAQKMVSRTLEDIQSYTLSPTEYPNFTYSSTSVAAAITAKKVQLSDGNYNAVITIDDKTSTMTKICIDDGQSLKYEGTIENGSNIKDLKKAATFAACS